MRRRLIPTALVAAGLLVGLSACTTTLEVKPQYVTAGVTQPVVKGHASIVMSEADLKQMYNGHPTSFTGGATSVNLPIGEVVSSVGEKVCTAYFTNGATRSSAPRAGDYVVSVKSAGFSYKYDQLSSLGFAITPKVTIGLQIGINAPDGSVIAPDKLFQRTDFAATGAYMVSIQPAEKINQSLHVALADIYREALDQLPRK